MDHARAVIIGGGVGGTSVAYHLAERGWTDVEEVTSAEESLLFALPPELRRDLKAAGTR